MSAALLAVALVASGTDAQDWFRAVQYAAKPTALRGCSECQGEPDDVCEVRAGALARALGESTALPSPAPNRVKLLRSKADPDCAVQSATLFGARGTVELAALRLARTPPSAALIDRFAVRLAVVGWPRAPQRRKGQRLVAVATDRAELRTALVCWGAQRAWPTADLGPATLCEWWLLPVRSDNEPDLARPSFPLIAGRDRWPEKFRFGDPRWSRAFDRSLPLDEAVLLGSEARAEAQPAAPPPPAPVTPTAPAIARCGEGRVRTAVLDRFDQWEAGIVGPPKSLDRTAWSLDAAAWSGHCQELDVLRSALEQQLGCALAQAGRCVGLSALKEEAR
ncbi:MAG: hypothetical protein E6J58_10705 [Deltaproteobacteria bacterium]|nr:MAG: hypothetical protein E6J58_10705 [Deltaproteobacteria bacterium]